MKISLFIVLFFSVISASSIKKVYLPYTILITKADLIVEGEVLEIKDNSYTFKVKDRVKGLSSQLITVEIWKEWTCDIRVKDLTNSQHLLLFLKKSKTSVYNIINGSTGELFIEENKINNVFHSLNQPLEISEIKNGIQMFLKAFDFKGDLYSTYKNQEERYFIKFLNQSKINEMKTQNRFFKALIPELKYYEIR